MNTSMGVSLMSLGKVDAFGQAFFFKSPAYGIIIGIDKVFETVGQPQDEQDGGIVAQGYAGVTFFKSSQSVVGIRRLLRASLMSAPNFLSAAFTGPGNGDVVFMREICII